MIPEAVEGCSVLDLGSGSGRDCYALSRLVGDTGRVVGIDMTEEQVRMVHTQQLNYTIKLQIFLFYIHLNYR